MVAAFALAAGLTAQADPAPKPDPSTELRAINKEFISVMTSYQISLRSHQRAVTKAKANGEPAPEEPAQPDLTPLVERCEAAAAAHAGTDDAVGFLIWNMTVGARMVPDAGKRAARTIAEHHADSPDLDSLAPILPQVRQMVGRELADKLLTAILRDNEDHDIVGWATLGLHAQALESADVDSEEYAVAREALRAVAKDARSRLRNEINNKIKMREELGKGRQAPDIAGVDLDGVEFKLSDYKGKVVFLDFWGDW